MLKIETYGDQKYITLDQLKVPEWYKKNKIAGRDAFLKRSLLECGVKRPIVVNNSPGREGIIVDGVATFLVAKSLGINNVPVFLIEESKINEMLLHVVFNTSVGDISREQMILLMESKYCSFFEPDDSILMPTDTYSTAVEAGEEAMKSEKDKAKPIRRLICNLPSNLAELPEKAMREMGTSSINETVILLMKLAVEGDDNA